MFYYCYNRSDYLYILEQRRVFGSGDDIRAHPYIYIWRRRRINDLTSFVKL